MKPVVLRDELSRASCRRVRCIGSFGTAEVVALAASRSVVWRWAVGTLMLVLLAEKALSAKNSKPRFVSAIITDKDRKAHFFNIYADAAIRWRPQLTKMGGLHLIFVHYGPQHNFEVEWIYNRADIDRANIVLVREVDPASDRPLADYYSSPSLWSLDADANPVKLDKSCCWLLVARTVPSQP